MNYQILINPIVVSLKMKRANSMLILTDILTKNIVFLALDVSINSDIKLKFRPVHYICILSSGLCFYLLNYKWLHFI